LLFILGGNMSKELAIKKLELLLNDLKINEEEERRSRKSYFNTQLFAIRVNEIYRILKNNN
jgi:hypothetical protein